jgi:tetratricopeptide (TPR) repeat protein
LKPDYSNAKYYLGLNYYYLNRVNDAILQFKDLVSLNPDNKEIKDILENLEDGYSPFAGMSKTQTSQVLDLEEDSTIIEE